MTWRKAARARVPLESLYVYSRAIHTYIRRFKNPFSKRPGNVSSRRHFSPGQWSRSTRVSISLGADRSRARKSDAPLYIPSTWSPPAQISLCARGHARIAALCPIVVHTCAHIHTPTREHVIFFSAAESAESIYLYTWACKRMGGRRRYCLGRRGNTRSLLIYGGRAYTCVRQILHVCSALGACSVVQPYDIRERERERERGRDVYSVDRLRCDSQLAAETCSRSRSFGKYARYCLSCVRRLIGCIIYSVCWTRDSSFLELLGASWLLRWLFPRLVKALHVYLPGGRYVYSWYPEGRNSKPSFQSLML